MSRLAMLGDWPCTCRQRRYSWASAIHAHRCEPPTTPDGPPVGVEGGGTSGVRVVLTVPTQLKAVYPWTYDTRRCCRGVWTGDTSSYSGSTYHVGRTGGGGHAAPREEGDKWV